MNQLRTIPHVTTFSFLITHPIYSGVLSSTFYSLSPSY